MKNLLRNKKMRNKIKIGILLNNYFVANWAYKMIEEINNSSFAEIVLVVKNESKKKKRKRR